MATASGALLPATTLVFGQLIDDFGSWQFQKSNPYLTLLPNPITPDQLTDKVSSMSLVFIYLAIGTFIATYLYMSISVYVALASSNRIRQEYLKAVLRQDIAWFDTVGAGEVATRITSDTLLVQGMVYLRFVAKSNM